MKKSTRVSAYITVFSAFAMLLYSLVIENNQASFAWLIALVFISYSFYCDFFKKREDLSDLEKDYDELVQKLHKRLIQVDEDYDESELYIESDKKMQEYENKFEK